MASSIQSRFSQQHGTGGKNLSGVGFEPTPSIEDQKSPALPTREQGIALSLAP